MNPRREHRHALKSPFEMSDEKHLPQVKPLGSPESIPVFNCVLFVRRENSGVVARVANVKDMVFTATSEREAIQQAVTRFKDYLKKTTAEGRSRTCLKALGPPRMANSND